MAESNGNVSALVEESEAATAGLVEDLPTTTDAAEAVEEPIRVSKGIYFVRVPRPHFDDTTIKNLQQELTTQIGKLKAINGKMQVKRGEANALRQQLTDARGIREGSKPEYEDKMSRIKELQDMRKGIMDRISIIRSGQKGLDVKTEEDLDAKIQQLEEEIQSGQVPLRVEKQLVQNISKLRNQREKVREFENQQGDLAQLEDELKKVRSMLSDLQDEFKIITGERDQVKTIISDFQAKLKVVTDALSDLDLERQEIEAHKTEIQEQLKTAREETDAAMFEYRENRKLSLQLRDLVDAGSVDDATKIAEEQVELYLAKLINDPGYRKEYTNLWSEQRKYIVSELLPKSGVSNAAFTQPLAKGGDKGKGAKAPAPLVPQGAAKAQAAIAAALEAASQALVAQRKAAPEPEPEESSDDEVAEPASSQPAEPVRRIVPGATDELTAPSRPRQQHKASEYVVPEVPDVDYEFVPPVIKRDEKEQLTDKERKERIREEQRLKAAEAEERKKRRAETQEKKKQKAAEQARKLEAEAKAKQRAVAAEAAVSQEVAEVAASASEEEPETIVAAAVEKPAKGSKAGGGNKPGKRPVRVDKVPKLPKKVKKWYMEYGVHLAVGGCVLVLLLLVLMAFAVPART